MNGTHADTSTTAAKPKTARSAVDRLVSLCASELRHVEDLLAARMDSPVGPIPQVGAHLLGAGGKRLRPLLAVIAARAAGVSLDIAAAVGCAAELIHTATLYHDDVVDDGRVRRGRPAARMVWGNGVVVLVGDFCLARALETVALTGDVRIVQSLASTVTEMAEGEVAQLEGAGNPDATVDGYFRVIDRKTASLIAWCARVGGASADPEIDGALSRYGRAIGRAFQIVDDVLDCSTTEAIAGKPVGHDLQEGKMTLPVLLACEADAGLRDRIRRDLGERGMSAANAAAVLELVRAAGGVEKAREKALSLVEEALRDLNALPASPHREALVDLAHHCIERVS